MNNRVSLCVVNILSHMKNTDEVWRQSDQHAQPQSIQILISIWSIAKGELSSLFDLHFILYLAQCEE